MATRATSDGADAAERRGDRTRARLLEAAADELVTHGLDGLRGARLAATVGVSEGTVWFHLGTKAGLLIAVMEAYYDELVADLEDVIEAASTPRDRFDAFVRFWLRRIARDLPLTAEFGRHGRDGRDPEMLAAFASCNRRVTRRFERLVEDLVAGGVLRADVPPRVVRDVFFGAAEHVLVGRAVTGRGGADDTAALDAAADALLDVVLHGVAARPPTATPAAPTARAAADTATSLARIDAKLDALLARP